MEGRLRTLLAGDLLGNPIERWLATLGVAVAGLAVLLLVRRVLVRRLRGRAERTGLDESFTAEALAGTHGAFVALASIAAAAATLLSLPEAWATRLRLVLGVAGLLQVGVWGNVAVRFAVTRFLGRQGDPEDPGRYTGEALIRLLGRTVVWSAVVLLLLANLGVDITALVAGLGVGGIAVALALQNVLSDLFASFSILFDKPFRRGDFIIVGEFLGVVEKIGLKTTRIRSLWGEQVIVSNGDLLASRVRNYKRMLERRIHFRVGVVYGTPSEKLPLVVRILRESIEAQERARFDRAHFNELADFSLVFEAAYYVLSPDYNVYMDVHQAILLSIFRRFEEEGIEFAFPTRTVHLHREPPTEAT